MLLPNVSKFMMSLMTPLCRMLANSAMPMMAYMNITRKSRAPMLKSAGKDTIRANSSFRMPFAACQGRERRHVNKNSTPARHNISASLCLMLPLSNHQSIVLANTNTDHNVQECCLQMEPAVSIVKSISKRELKAIT